MADYSCILGDCYIVSQYVVGVKRFFDKCERAFAKKGSTGQAVELTYLWQALIWYNCARSFDREWDYLYLVEQELAFWSYSVP